MGFSIAFDEITNKVKQRVPSLLEKKFTQNIQIFYTGRISTHLKNHDFLGILRGNLTEEKLLGRGKWIEIYLYHKKWEKGLSAPALGLNTCT